MSMTPPYLCTLLALVPALGWAQAVLRDPTMPPPGVLVASPGGADEARSAGPVAAGPVGPAAAQSVIRITPVGGGQAQAAQRGPSLKTPSVVNATATGVVLQDSRGARTVSVPADAVRKKPVSGLAAES